MTTTTASKTRAAKKILVVEDEGEIGLLLNIILNEKNLELDYVNNLVAADEYLQKEEPSVIILDNKLPDGFGVDFVSYIKKEYADIKIIMNFINRSISLSVKQKNSEETLKQGYFSDANYFSFNASRTFGAILVP